MKVTTKCAYCGYDFGTRLIRKDVVIEINPTCHCFRKLRTALGYTDVVTGIGKRKVTRKKVLKKKVLKKKVLKKKVLKKKVLKKKVK